MTEYIEQHEGNELDKLQLVDDLGICECIYKGYIDHECELDEINHVEFGFSWVCNIFGV